MIEIFKRNPAAVVIALAMHLVIVLFMLVGVDWLKKPQQPKSVVEVVQARVVDQAKINAEVEKLKQAETAKKKKHDAVKRKEEQQLADLKKKQQKEKKRLADLEKKRKVAETKAIKEAEQKKVAKAKRLAAEKKRKADEKKRKALEVKRKAKEKAQKLAAEKKRKAVAAKKKAEQEKQRKAAEAKRKAAADAKRKAEAARQARENELQARMREEQFAREGMSVRAAIFNKVADNWVYMPGAVEKGLKCTVRVRLGVSGAVLLAQVVKSSGDTAFDRSVETAVRKSEPLPMPSTPELRNHPDFREHTFVFDPSQSR
ncbi:MAG: cell envelope integrity protein TolA [Candidatus Sedimenticola sp. (ex Thyasira tokunagai)]